MVTHFLGINIGVRMETKKVGVRKKAIHFSIPSSRSLLKAIERFLRLVKQHLSHFEYA